MGNNMDTWSFIEGIVAYNGLMTVDFPIKGYDEKKNEIIREKPYMLSNKEDREKVDRAMLFIFKYSRCRISYANFRGEKKNPGIDDILDKVMEAFEGKALVRFRYNEKSVSPECFIAFIKRVCEYKIADWNRKYRGKKRYISPREEYLYKKEDIYEDNKGKYVFDKTPTMRSMDETTSHDEDETETYEIPDYTYCPETTIMSGVNMAEIYCDIIHNALLMDKYVDNGRECTVSLPIRILFTISRLNGFQLGETSFKSKNYDNCLWNIYTKEDIIGMDYSDVREYLIDAMNSVFDDELVNLDMEYILEGFDKEFVRKKLDSKIFKLPSEITVNTSYARLNSHTPYTVDKEQQIEYSDLI